MRGIKLFINQTDYKLSVELENRSGNEMSKEPNRVLNFLLNQKEEKTVQYGDEQNPYLNKLVATAAEKGDFMQSHWKPLMENSAIEICFNGHDTVIFSLESNTIVAIFENRGID